MLAASSSSPEKEGEGEPALNCGRSTAGHGPGYIPRLSQPSTGPKRFCGLPAAMLALPGPVVTGPSGLIAGTALAKHTVTGHCPWASANRATGAPVI